MDSLGLSFSPTNDRSALNQQQPGVTNASPSPIQDAIKVLNLRIPKVTGPGAVAPGPLLNGAGAGGLDLRQLLALLFGQHGMAGGPSFGSAPMPNVTPGVVNTEPAPGTFNPPQPDFTMRPPTPTPMGAGFFDGKFGPESREIG